MDSGGGGQMALAVRYGLLVVLFTKLRGAVPASAAITYTDLHTLGKQPGVTSGPQPATTAPLTSANAGRWG